MTEGAPAIFVALEGSGLGAIIRQSRWIYMVANIGHIVALALFAGAVALIDVRLAGGFAATSPAHVIGMARRIAVLAFGFLVISGVVLFTAEASHVILNRAFQFKLALIALGLANVAWVEFVMMPKIAMTLPNISLPRGTREAGFISIAVWMAVAICGRAIAYF